MASYRFNNINGSYFDKNLTGRTFFNPKAYFFKDNT